MATEYAPGDLVKIFLPRSESTLSAAMKKFDGRVTRIRKVLVHRHKTLGTFYTYCLEECQSEHGNYYEFLKQWLVPWEGVEE